ncbi:MAG TPA: PIG-L family deacetylase [Mycobacteriales bacterium]|nr:PIG-L family deacetylase [Mycobacteriales bacterium]
MTISFRPGTVVLVVQAHPDDETFTTAAATLAAKQAGCTVHLRIFTGGEGYGAELTPAGLARARERKAAMLDAAVPQLGIDDWDYLGSPDRWNDTPEAPERTIAAADLDDLTATLLPTIEALRPDVILTVGPDGLTGHPDHIACHHATLAAARAATVSPRAVLGAFLPADDIRAAEERASELYGRPIGAGRLVGRRPQNAVTITAGADATGRRKAALEVYVPGLGTRPQEDLPAAFPDGEAVLIRLVFDHAGWDRDRFELLLGE